MKDVEGRGWWNEDRQQSWADLVTNYMRSEVKAFDEAVASAAWISNHLSLLSEEHATEYFKMLERFLEDEVPQLAEDENDLGKIEDMRDALCEIRDSLKIDLDSPSEMLRERIQALEEKPSGDAEDWQERTSGSGSGIDIDALFDTLRN
jgi:hypothetical protein